MARSVDVDELASSATLLTTPCGHGKITWRRWGRGSPVVLLHGTAGSWTHWVRNIGALAVMHTVYVPDLPGFGDSDSLAEPHTFANIAATLWAGLDELCPDRPSIALAGFSFGSVVAESMALERGDQIRRLVLVRGNFNDQTPRLPGTLKKWRGLADPKDVEAAHRHNLAVMMFHDSAKIDEQAVMLHAENSRRSMLDPALFFPSRPLDALRKIAGPVAGITGEFDSYGLPDPRKQGEALLEVRPDAIFHIIPTAGHWAIYESAEKVNPILLDMFSR
ncbi:alpha/beta fold hydrolase [Noviherbaspirillum saxi]|nr:alpha/beta fold hydrolase [Noviherbaspirillum saxi]